MADLQAHDELRRWLLNPGVYAHRPGAVEEIQTHISCVFLAGDLVYKLKKPVRFDFLDFSTVEQRGWACREELRLNRRLTSGVYLDVLAISRQPDGSLAWGPGGEVVDWVVEMRRLPTEHTLDALHARGELTPQHIERLMEILVRFYHREQPLPLTEQAYRQRCTDHIRGNLQELLAPSRQLSRRQVQRVHSFQLQLLQLRPAMFDERVRAGKIVDGHGDLRPEHICFDEQIQIFDCIEFNAEFRQLDIVDELAFFAAECDFLGAEWVGPLVWDAYRQQSNDRPPPALVDFYRSYRACVRAKVAALRGEQVDPSSAERFTEETQRHLELADGYCRGWATPLAIVVGGLSGTGKTTLATLLAGALGAELLRTDVVRQEIFGAEQHEAAADQGNYTPEARRRVYDELICRAARLQSEGVSVVLDGTFSALAELEHAQQTAMQAASFFAIECVCRPEVACERIARRRWSGNDASEARVETHRMQQLRWQSWGPDIPQARIDTELALETQFASAVEAIAQGVHLAADGT